VKKLSLFTLVSLVVSGPLLATDFSGYLAVEAAVFPNDAQFENQFDANLTLSFKPRWQGDWNDGDDNWSAELFFRADGKDDERQHVDVRELMWLHLDGDSEWRVGFNTMFWGVTESQHLVDVINQVDAVEGVDGEDKLGQPMIHWKRYEDWGVVDLLILPGFRERSFYAEEGRLRPPLVVDADLAEFESSDEEKHIDLAMRYSQTFGDLDLGLSWFDGTNRDPVFIPRTANNITVLVPYYGQMTQFGIDALLIYENWIWKLELIHRNQRAGDYNAFTYGFEYTFYGINESDVDLGSIVEFSYDSRRDGERGVFDRDLFVGGRFAFNDEKSSEILAGLFFDTDNGSQSFRVEGSRRVGDNLKLSLELQTFSRIDPDDPLQAFSDDDFIQMEAAWYY
jgi:hypothetical protein